jgi:hypothetical protein
MKLFILLSSLLLISACSALATVSSANCGWVQVGDEVQYTCTGTRTTPPAVKE